MNCCNDKNQTFALCYDDIPLFVAIFPPFLINPCNFYQIASSDNYLTQNISDSVQTISRTVLEEEFVFTMTAGKPSLTSTATLSVSSHTIN